MPLTLSALMVVLAVGAVAYVIGLAHRSLVLLAPWRRVAITVLRCLLVLLLLLAIFEVKWKRRTDQLAVLFVLDYSDSVSMEAKLWAQNYLRAASEKMKVSDRAGLLVFGEETYVEIAPSPRPEFLAQLDSIGSLPTTSYTNIARAIRLALAVFPEGAQRRIVLLTDGEENLGDARGEAIVAAAGGTQIEAIPLQETRESEVLIERMVVPGHVQQDSTFDVKLLVQSTESGSARVRFFQDGHYIGQKEVELQPGKNLFAFPQKLAQPGFHTFEARIEALGDSRAENNVARGYSIVRGPPKVLYLANPDQPRLSPVPRQLEKEGILVELRSRSAVPSELSELQNYDCLVLDNVTALSFTTAQMRIVERYVHDLGGGLIMIGGQQSFGPGLYMDTPIEEALPVHVTIKDKRHFPSFGQVIVIDKSGSMGMTAPSGKQKIELAAEGAIRSVELLNDQDSIGLLATDTQPKWVAPLRKATDRNAIIADIATVRAGGGGIYVYSGLREAFDRLAVCDAMVRHIILFADGSDAEQHEGCEALTEEMVRANMTLTCVSLGKGRDVPFLKDIAERTGGRFHLTEDIDQVPQIFTKETILARRSYLIEEPFAPEVRTTGGFLRGLNLEAMPQLLGYVGTTPKDRAEVLMVSHKGDPVLAAWRYGLGKSIAFTSDTQPRWAQYWLGWEQFGKFWTQAVRWALRTAAATHLQSQVDIARGEGTLTIDALDEEGDFLNFLQLRATVLSPSLERFERVPRQTAPGRYEASFPAREVGAYMVSVVDETPSSPQQGSRDVSGIALSYPVEFKPSGKGPSLIKQLVETAQGEVLVEPSQLEGVFRHTLQARHAAVGLWQDLIGWVVLLLPLDIALRRLTLTAEQWQKIYRALALWRWLIPGRRAVPVPDRTLTQLKEVKAEWAGKEPPQEDRQRTEQIARLQKALQQAMDRRPESLSPSPEPPSGEKEQSTTPPQAEAPPATAADFTSRLLEAKRRARHHRPEEDNGTSSSDFPASR